MDRWRERGIDREIDWLIQRPLIAALLHLSPVPCHVFDGKSTMAIENAHFPFCFSIINLLESSLLFFLGAGKRGTRFWGGCQHGGPVLTTHVYIYIYSCTMCIYIYIWIYTDLYTNTHLSCKLKNNELMSS